MNFEPKGVKTTEILHAFGTFQTFLVVLPFENGTAKNGQKLAGPVELISLELQSCALTCAELGS